jgi:LysM repeat protein
MPFPRFPVCVRIVLPLALAAIGLAYGALPAHADRTVVVRRGDTLSGISLANYGDVGHVAAILAYNHLANPDRISAGQTLRLPGLDPGGPSRPLPAIQVGVATWYGPGFEGKTTKCGQTYRQLGYSAASNDLPCGSLIDVINLLNERHLVVPVTDTGAFRHPNVVDLSRGAFSALASPDLGVIPVRIILRDAPPPRATPATRPGR